MGLFDQFNIPEMFGMIPGLVSNGITEGQDLLSISDSGRPYAESASFRNPMMDAGFMEDNNTYDMIMNETGDPLAAQEATENQIVSMLIEEDYFGLGMPDNSKMVAATDTISSLEAFGLLPKDTVSSVAANYGVPQGELQTVVDQRDQAKQSWKDSAIDENYLGLGIPEGMLTPEEVVISDTSNQGKLNDEIIRRTQEIQGSAPQDVGINDPAVAAALLQIQEVFSDNYNYPSVESFSDQYFLSRINEVLDNYNVNANANEILAGWGANPRFEAPVTETTDTTQTTETTQPTGIIPIDSPEYLSVYRQIQNGEIDYFSQNNIGGLFVDNNKTVFNLDNNGLDLYRVGQMQPAGESGGIEYYSFGNETWEYNPAGRAGMPWSPVQTQPATQGTGMPGFQLPPAALTDVWSPEQTWEAMRVSQMGDDIYNPVMWGARNVGFAPAKGQYLLSGANQPFADFLPTAQGLDMSNLWSEAVEASAAMGAPMSIQDFTPQQFGIQGLLGGDAARENALLMSYAALGGGPGVGGQAMYSRLGQMYDIFAAQQAAQGLPASGFLDYLNNMLAPGAVRPSLGPAAIATPNESYAGQD